MITYSGFQWWNIKILFKSFEEAARFLNLGSRISITISNQIEKWIKGGGINGYYLFSKELNNIEKFWQTYRIV